MRTIVNREDSIMRKLDADDDGEQQKKEARQVLFTLHSKTAIFTHRIVAYCRDSYFIIIFLLTVSYFALIYLLNINFSIEKSKLLAYEDSFFTTERNIMSMSVGMYHLTLSGATFQGLLSSTVLINTYFTHPLPP